MTSLFMAPVVKKKVLKLSWKFIAVHIQSNISYISKKVFFDIFMSSLSSAHLYLQSSLLKCIKSAISGEMKICSFKLFEAIYLCQIYSIDYRLNILQVEISSSAPF